MTTLNIKPPKFRGTSREDLDTFLSQLKLRFREASITTEEEKTRRTIECLQGDAARWVANKVNSLRDDELVVPKVWKDYQDFVKYLREQSGQYYDLKETAETLLHNVSKGKGSILMYNDEFERITSYLPAGYGEEPKIYNYIKGLPDQTQRQLGTIPGNKDWKLEDWMSNAVNLERGIAHIHAIRQDHAPKYRQQGQPSYQPGYEPMDVDR